MTCVNYTGELTADAKRINEALDNTGVEQKEMELFMPMILQRREAQAAKAKFKGKKEKISSQLHKNQQYRNANTLSLSWFMHLKCILKFYDIGPSSSELHCIYGYGKFSLRLIGSAMFVATFNLVTSVGAP